MKTESQLDRLVAEYKQDRKKHPIKWMWKDFKWWLITSINWVRIKLTKKNKSKMKTEPTINIQDEVSKIHAQYGITEMANYRIEKLFEKYVEQFSPKVKQLEWVVRGPMHYVNQFNPIGYTAAITRWAFGENQYSVRLGLNDGNNSTKIFNSLDEAKDFVQKDFEKRVKECLTIE